MNQPHTLAWSKLSRLLQQLAFITAGIAIAMARCSPGAGRTITIVVPATPASGPDILSRTIGEEWRSVANVPASSASMRREYPCTSAHRTVVSRRFTLSSVIVPMYSCWPPNA